MKNITVYSGPMCGYCDAANRLLERNNLEFTDIDVSTKDGLRDEITKKPTEEEQFHKYFLMMSMWVDIKS